MPAIISAVSTEANTGSYKRAFPNEPAGVVREVRLSNGGQTLRLRRVSDPTNIAVIEVSATVQNLGLMESADIEVLSNTATASSVYFIGSHPNP